MTEQPAGERPGHLDIDAVSAFVDRDLHPDDLPAVELHLAACSACQREVLEIEATVLLLAGLPQYTPRRSFCLSGEHARAARRPRFARSSAWASPLAPHGSPVPAAAHIVADRYSGALAGLHTAALVIGALLLLVASSDFLGIPPQPAAWLGEESAPVMMSVSAPPPAAAPEEPAAREAPAPASGVMVTATAYAAESSFGMFSEQADGTAPDNRASQGLEAAEDEAPQAPLSEPTSNTAPSIQAQPTAAAILGQSSAGETQETADAATEPTPQATEQPSRLRLVEIALAFGLAWLIVTIAGLRWVRRLR
jgi:hypothetical protein